MKLSIIIPVFNEVATIKEIVSLVRKIPVEHEIILIDDASNDGSEQILQELAGESDTLVLSHHVNLGKGAAIASGLKAATGDVAVIQDADLEYDPQDFVKMLRPIDRGEAHVLYGVRELQSQKAFMRLGNRFLTWLASILYDAKLSDIETCYKMMSRDVFETLSLKCQGFDVEAEITAKILNAGYEIHELPIYYHARYDHKKLTPMDGLPTLLALVKYRFFK